MHILITLKKATYNSIITFQESPTLSHSLFDFHWTWYHFTVSVSKCSPGNLGYPCTISYYIRIIGLVLKKRESRLSDVSQRLLANFSGSWSYETICRTKFERSLAYTQKSSDDVIYHNFNHDVIFFRFEVLSGRRDVIATYNVIKR